MIEMKQRQNRHRLALVTMMSLATLFMAGTARANTSVSVTSGGVSPDPVGCGQMMSVTFSATLSGEPGSNTTKECVARNVKWSWSVTVSGPGGSQNYTNPNGSSSYTLSHTPNVAGVYSISATATASYEADADCGGNSSSSGSASDSTLALNTTCGS